MTLDARIDDVRRLAGPHQFRGFDAAHGADFDLRSVTRLIIAGEIGEDMPGRHRREAREPPLAHPFRRM